MYMKKQMKPRELDDQEIEERQAEMFEAAFKKMDADKFLEILIDGDEWGSMLEFFKAGQADKCYALNFEIVAGFLTPSREDAARAIRDGELFNERLQDGSAP